MGRVSRFQVSNTYPLSGNSPQGSHLCSSNPVDPLVQPCRGVRGVPRTHTNWMESMSHAGLPNKIAAHMGRVEISPHGWGEFRPKVGRVSPQSGATRRHEVVCRIRLAANWIARPPCICSRAALRAYNSEVGTADCTGVASQQVVSLAVGVGGVVLPLPF